MSSQDEYDYIDTAEFDDIDNCDDYSDALVNDYQEKENDDFPLHADGPPYDDDDGRRSPTESLLTRRHNQQHVRNEPLQSVRQHQLTPHHNQQHRITEHLQSPRQHRLTLHRNQQHPSTEHVQSPHQLPHHDSETSSTHQGIGIALASPLSKRRLSRSPSPLNQTVPPRPTGHTTFLRSVSSPQQPHVRSSSLLPDQQVLPPSQRARLSNFIHYRESQHGSPSVSSGKSSNLAGRQAHSNHPGPSSPTSSRQQVSSGPLYSQTPQPYSHRHDDSLPSAQDTVDSLFNRRHVLRASHSASDSWYELYETLELGTLPLPDQCGAAPPTQQPLAKVPKHKSVRKSSILGHFFDTYSPTEFQCKVVDD
ncbi:MAG: hypothetical protein BYD32DRAFT_436720 [Podila humilis]|nr:MAG: hypothetical protein BYD32DRAFT_436720 [Podila humilis]